MFELAQLAVLLVLLPVLLIVSAIRGPSEREIIARCLAQEDHIVILDENGTACEQETR